ncbi:MAG: DUF2271 domain-containing protein [Pirellulales bacterium]
MSLFLVLLCVQFELNAEQFTFHHENVLGTSFELRVECSSATAAKRVEQLALAEIDRLNHILSSYDSSAELASFNGLSIGQTMKASAELLELLKRCEAWQVSSQGAFNPAVEALTRRWKRAAAENSLPTEVELKDIVGRINAKHWSVDMQAGTVTKQSTEPISLNAIAKGSILDAAAEQIQSSISFTPSLERVDGATIVIGGDIRIVGNMNQLVSVPNPRRDALGGPIISQVVINSGAIATSGSSERGFDVEGKRYSHIFNPTTGKPCDEVLSASVIADNAETADILATVCCVLPTDHALRLVNSLPNVRCMIYTATGSILFSANWQQNGQTGQSGASKAAETPYDFQLEFEIAKSSDGGRYRRPYVAAWVEDKDGFPVKTLSLFLMADNPGPRWHRDLRRWYASDQVRLLVDPTKLIGTISKPTRNPGVYKVAWDGTDDHGKVLSDGEYTLFIEAAREHGTYQLMKFAFAFGKKDFEEKLKGNVEIKEASFRYKKK